MQLKFAKETLSSCIGNVSKIQEDILPENGIRRDRMNKFLQFILQEDWNVIMFEKMLQNYGIEKLLRMQERAQDIGIYITFYNSLEHYMYVINNYIISPLTFFQ